MKYVDSCCVLLLSAYARRDFVRRFESRLTTYKMLALNSSKPTFFVADMVIPFGRYGLFVWPMWSWPIWFVADMVQTRGDLCHRDRRTSTSTSRLLSRVTTCLALVRALIVSNFQQGGLLQLGSRWYPRPAARPAAVRLECRRPFGFLSEAVRTHNPIAS